MIWSILPLRRIRGFCEIGYKLIKITNVNTKSILETSFCDRSTLTLAEYSIGRVKKTGLHYCIFLILDKNCLHFQPNFMSVMGIYLQLNFVIWSKGIVQRVCRSFVFQRADLSGQKQFYLLYCARFSHINTFMNLKPQIKSRNL